jgi:hypothetical protein
VAQTAIAVAVAGTAVLLFMNESQRSPDGIDPPTLTATLVDDEVTPPLIGTAGGAHTASPPFPARAAMVKGRLFTTR